MKTFIYSCFGLLLLLSSCEWRKASWEMHEVTTEREKIYRYDRLVDEFVSLNSFSALQRMNTEFPTATRLLIEDVLTIGSVEDAHIERRLREYYLDSTIQVLLQDVHKEYADLSAEEKDLFSVFQQIKMFDSSFRIPQIYTQVSGLNQSIVVGDSILGISLDKYLGADYPLYKKYFYDWQYRRMDRTRLVPDALYFYLSYSYPLPQSEVHTFLDYIVDYGKFHWIIAHCRGISLTREAGFDERKVAWYRKNEGKVWQWMKNNNAFASSDRTMIKHFLQPRPNTLYIGTDSPDQIGFWLGLQIVRNYMETHPDKTMKDLLNMTDYKTLLQESGYNPDK